MLKHMSKQFLQRLIHALLPQILFLSINVTQKFICIYINTFCLNILAVLLNVPTYYTSLFICVKKENYKSLSGLYQLYLYWLFFKK